MLKRAYRFSIVALLAVGIPLIGIGAWSYANACDGQSQQASAQAAKSSCWEAAVVVAQTCGKTAKTTKTACSKKAKTKAASACCKDAACAGKCAGCKKKAAAAKAKELEMIKAVASDLPYRETYRLVMDGKYVCGKCELKKFDGCKAFFKTTDGDIYPLVVNQIARKLKTAKSKNGFRITSRVKRIDGIKHLEIKSFEML